MSEVLDLQDLLAVQVVLDPLDSLVRLVLLERVDQMVLVDNKEPLVQREELVPRDLSERLERPDHLVTQEPRGLQDSLDLRDLKGTVLRQVLLEQLAIQVHQEMLVLRELLGLQDPQDHLASAVILD